MNKVHTNYSLRDVSDSEIVSAFGSLAACLRITGGDLPTILFYLSNKDRIVSAPFVATQAGDFAERFRERAHKEAAGEAFDAMEKPSIAGVARSMGVCRSVAKRALVAPGRVLA